MFYIKGIEYHSEEMIPVIVKLSETFIRGLIILSRILAHKFKVECFIQKFRGHHSQSRNAWGFLKAFIKSSSGLPLYICKIPPLYPTQKCHSDKIFLIRIFIQNPFYLADWFAQTYKLVWFLSTSMLLLCAAIPFLE